MLRSPRKHLLIKAKAVSLAPSPPAALLNGGTALTRTAPLHVELAGFGVHPPCHHSLTLLMSNIPWGSLLYLWPPLRQSHLWLQQQGVNIVLSSSGSVCRSTVKGAGRAFLKCSPCPRYGEGLQARLVQNRGLRGGGQGRTRGWRHHHGLCLEKGLLRCSGTNHVSLHPSGEEGERVFLCLVDPRKCCSAPVVCLDLVYVAQ